MAQPGNHHGSCAACERDIIWAWTEQGKRMPVDPKPTMRGTLEQSRGKMQFVMVPIYESHFATCPQAEEFRRPTHAFVPRIQDGKCSWVNRRTHAACDRAEADHYDRQSAEVIPIGDRE